MKALADKGEIENALRTQREQAEQQINAERTQRAAIEERAKRYALDGELSRVLSGQRLVPGGAEQLMQLWRNQLQVEPHGDTYLVRTPTFQNVADFVQAKLAEPHYAHFLRADSAGGSAGSGSSGSAAAPTPPAHPATPPEPKTLSEAIILQIQARDKEAAADPRFNMAAPMGLRRPG